MNYNKIPAALARVATNARSSSFVSDARFLYMLGLAVVIIACAGLRIFLTYTFPVPWPDEAAFLSQAFALYHDGTLKVFALNPDRDLMWMPPGFMVSMAAIFQMFGYSFGVARAAATAFYGLAWAGVLLVGYRALRGWARAFAMPLIVLCAIFPPVLVIANIARMESELFLLEIIALLLVLHGRLVAAISIAVLTGVVHFNAVYFLLPLFPEALIAIFGKVMYGRPLARSRWEWGFAGVTTLGLVSYAIYVLFNLSGFMADMRWQFAVKSGIPFIALALKIHLLAAGALVWVYSIGVRLRGDLRPSTLSGFGFAFMLMAVYGREVWYDFALLVGLLLCITACLHLLGQLPSRRFEIAGLGSLLFFSFLRLGVTQAPASAPIAPWPPGLSSRRGSWRRPTDSSGLFPRARWSRSPGASPVSSHFSSGIWRHPNRPGRCTPTAPRKACRSGPPTGA